MKIDKMSLFLRLSGFSQGMIVVIAAFLLLNLIGLFLGYGSFDTTPVFENLFLSPLESQLTQAQWSVLEKVSLLMALAFMYLAFNKLNKFGALLNRRIIFERAQSSLLKKSALYFLIGININTLILNIVSAVDSLNSKSRLWRFDGSWTVRLLVTFLIYLFLYIIADILLQGSKMKAENDLTI